MINRSLIIVVIATLLLLSCEAPEEAEEAPEPILSVDIIPKTKVIEPGGIITYKMDILNIGVGSLNIAVEHQLIELSSGKILQTKAETLTLQNQLILERGLAIPETAAGQYEIKTVINYADKSDTDRFEFEVLVEEPEPEKKEEDKTEEEKIQFVTEILNKELTQEELGDPDVTITITMWGYDPQEITVPVNGIVMWVNMDANSHTADGAGFDSGTIRRNGFFKHKFTKAGNYPYHDTYRSDISGMIHVTEASS